MGTMGRDAGGESCPWRLRSGYERAELVRDLLTVLPDLARSLGKDGRIRSGPCMAAASVLLRAAALGHPGAAPVRGARACRAGVLLAALRRSSFSIAYVKPRGSGT